MLLFFLLLLCIFEAYHDAEVIAGSNKNEYIHNRRWHKADAVIWSFNFALIAYLEGNWFYFFAGLVFRLFVLQVVLNRIRGLSVFYLSDKGIDGWFKRNMGLTGTLVFKTILFTLTFFYEIYMVH